MLNCAKETKLYTVLHIDNTRRRGKILLKRPEDEKDPVILDQERCPGVKNFDVNSFFLDAIYTEANAMAVGARFNLPGFAEIDQYMAKVHPTLTAYANNTPVDIGVNGDLTKDVQGNVFQS
jgi:hypothetical protein